MSCTKAKTVWGIRLTARAAGLMGACRSYENGVRRSRRSRESEESGVCVREGRRRKSMRVDEGGITCSFSRMDLTV
jgi:hypothetical protein